MFSASEFARTGNILRQGGELQLDEHSGQFHLSIRPTELLNWVEFLLEDLNFFILSDIVVVDHLHKNSRWRFEINYQFHNMENHQRLHLHVMARADEIIPSLVSYYPHAEWKEAEQGEMFGLRFGHSSPHLLLPEEGNLAPMRKDFSGGEWPIQKPKSLPRVRVNPNRSESPYPEESYRWKEFSLLSPETLGNFSWQVCFDPKTAVDSRVEIGNYHMGLEKILEKKSPLQILRSIDSLNPLCSPTLGILWARLYEEIHGCKIPERAQAIRMVLLELSRISSHLTILSRMTQKLGYTEAKLFTDCREKIFEVFESLTGHRQGFGTILFGGLNFDTPHGWLIQYQQVSADVSSMLLFLRKFFLSRGDFQQKLGGPSITAETVLRYSLTGPTLRAAGLNFDLRKSKPFYFYDDVDFDIPVGVEGRMFDRFLILLEEIFQSLRIVDQVVDNLPLGEVWWDPAPDFEKRFSGFSSLSLEAPNGELGISAHIVESSEIQRIKLLTPSFSTCQGLSALSYGLTEDQLPVLLESLGINRFELDR